MLWGGACKAVDPELPFFAINWLLRAEISETADGVSVKAVSTVQIIAY